jgi:arginine decarboxylase
LDDADAPLLDAWRVFVESGMTPFTIPGHKRRAERLWPTLGRVLDGDVPLYAGLGAMKDAAAVLEQAEAWGAQLWAADWCRYSTGGSTHTNQVAALAVGRPGDTVLVSRSAHRSTLSGLILAGLRPVWLPTDVDERFGLPRGVSADALRRALSAHPDAVAVFLVEPSYVGTVSDLPALVEVAHTRELPVVVDQAWGAHFGFHPGYPPHALRAGADIMITSAHKTLPAYSQAAIIAARTDRVEAGRLDRAFDAGATTSPAGSILASIDAARALLASATGRELLDRLPGLVEGARERLRRHGLTVPGPADFPAGRYDPAKLVLLFGGGQGLDVERSLIAAGLPVEQADRDSIVAIVTMLDDENTVGRLVDTVLAALGPSGAARPAVGSSVWTAPIPRAAMSPREAFFAARETVAMRDAVGRTSAELIAPYPPGIPLLAPGEVITPDVIDALRAAAESGARIAYARDPSLAACEVVIE